MIDGRPYLRALVADRLSGGRGQLEAGLSMQGSRQTDGLTMMFLPELRE